MPPLIRILALLLLYTEICSGLRDVRVTVPAAILRGETAVLYCHFDLEGDSLYSVKWYKGRREFYRYTPKETPAMKVFPIYGLEVSQEKSNDTQLTLKHVQLSLSGRYSCEVSADAPSFHTALVSGDMDIVEVPKGRPVISGIRNRYRIEDILHGNCSSGWSKPAAKLTWFVNGNPALASNLVEYPVIKERDGEREISYLGLKMMVKSSHFSHSGRLKIRCSASIHDVFYQSTEKSMEEERPRGMMHGTLSSGSGSGNGIQYIQPPPSFNTDLPPSGHRFEQDTQREVTTTQSSVVAMTVNTSALLLVVVLYTVR